MSLGWGRKRKVMSCSEVHMPVEVSQQNAVATGFRPVATVGNPGATAVGSALEVNAPVVSGPVQLVGLMAYVSQIAQAIIGSVVIDVVNNVRLLAVSKEPRQPVGKPRRFLKGDCYIALSINRTSNVASLDAATPVDFPFDDSSFRVIAKEIAHRIRNNFRSHAELPLSVVRGLVVRATSTPILPIVSTISKEFAVSGGNSRGTHGLPPCSTIRHPF
jgi:hypothetical protein